MIEVTATCAWCQIKIVTGLDEPLPDGWVQQTVDGPDITFPPKESFCCDAHLTLYQEATPACVEAAKEGYMTTFLARMNDARKAGA